jgi:hypothetical protein
MHEAIFRSIRFLWDNASHDNIAAFGSIAVAVFTFTLWRSTHKLWETTRESVLAAKQAAEALPTVERAYVFMVPDLKFGDQTIPHSSGIGNRYNSVSVHFKIENHGKTPAAVESVYVRLDVLAEPPDNRTHLISNILSGEMIVRSDDAWFPEEINPVIRNISESEFDDISNNRAAIWFYGSILYKDMFGGERTTRFRWCHSELLDVFTPRGEAPYNERA